MGEYRLTLPQALTFPLEAYLALVPALISRHGGRAEGPDHVDLAACAGREAAWAWLRAHFTILPPGVAGPANALARWLASEARSR